MLTGNEQEKFHFAVSAEALTEAKEMIALIKDGRSMKPALLPGDLVRIRRPELARPGGIAKRGDIVLYRSGEENVLHRVIDVGERTYTIAGDNNLWTEEIPKTEVFGIMTGIRRGTRELDRNSFIVKYFALMRGNRASLSIRKGKIRLKREVKRLLRALYRRLF